jgi:hypothetical protein
MPHEGNTPSSRPATDAVRRMTAEEFPIRCVVCGSVLTSGQRAYHGDLDIWTCADECPVRVDEERRVYDRSKRGRWRSRREVLARLRRDPVAPVLDAMADRDGITP